MRYIFYGTIIVLVLAALVAGSFQLLEKTQPASADGTLQRFNVPAGEPFSQTATRLGETGFIRSASAFMIIGFLKGATDAVQQGSYLLPKNQSAMEILSTLSRGPHQEVRVTVPEGSSVFEIDGILSDNLVTEPGALVQYATTADVEGRLFPDTYIFYTNSGPGVAAEKMLKNFEKKAGPLLAGVPEPEKVLALASLLEREVPEAEDRRIVADIVEKRLKARMPLQIDATICYVKKVQLGHQFGANGCYPLSPLDFKIDSPYNTYLYRGFPPGPIGSPGVSAISAALNPTMSPYWFYLSDPVSKRTIFSRTLEEHNKNRRAYLL